jgi:hypothetical protein
VRHCSPDQLALAALREPLPDGDAAHLADCPQCRDDVGALRRAVDVLSVPALATPAPAVAPPPRVWEAIAASTGVAVAPRSTAEAPVPAAAPGAVEAPSPAPTPLAARSRFGLRRPSLRWPAVAAAVLVGVAVGGGAVAITQRQGGAGTVVAQTALDPLSGAPASGRATVREEGSTRVLQIDLRAPVPRDGYYEVWLMETGAQLMVPVGVLHTGDTTLPLPDGLDLTAYPLVDVSVEPLDGNPAHSGDSVARGQLER